VKRASTQLFFSRRKRKAAGFSLVEIVIAISIVGLAFLAILGTLSVGVTNDQASSQQTVATNIAASIMADLRSTPSYANPLRSQIYKIDFPTNTPTTPPPAAPLSGVTPITIYFDNSLNNVGTGSNVPVAQKPVYTANVYMTVLATSPQTSYMVRVNVAWPAQAPIPAGGTAPAYVGNVDVIDQFISH
jgi:prepilin-type N-terminal cleavage/methylation domain-containing protein